MLKKILLLFIGLLNGCTSIGQYVANYPVDFREDQIIKNIAYGEKDYQKLDIYKPISAYTKSPVVIFFYGGGWTSGSKDIYPFVADVLVNQGFIVVVPDYAKYPPNKFPSFVEDGAKATKWVQDNIGDYYGNQQNITFIGHSAGGHLAAMLIADKHFLKEQKVDYKNIKGFVGLAGPYDFVPEEKIYKEIFAPKSHYPKMQVPNFIDGTEPPILLLHGYKDETVGIHNTINLKNAIETKKGKVKTVIYKNLDHIDLVSGFAKYVRKEKMMYDIEKFLNEVR
jgi:acetyl esterase/lipase